MGKEAHVVAALPDGPDEGRLYYELPKLIFRGARGRRVFEGDALKGVRADGGDLTTADGSRFALGEKKAQAWAAAIANPKVRLDKLGVKPGARVAILGVEDADLAEELASSGAVQSGELSGLDFLFYQADDSAALARIGDLVPSLAEKGVLWIVSRKGNMATVRDVEIMAAAKACGLVDNKVVGFSATLTALRFVRRRS